MFRTILKTLYDESGPALIAGIAICIALVLVQGLILPQSRKLSRQFSELEQYRLLTLPANNHESLRKRIVADSRELAARRATLTGGLAQHGDISATLRLLVEQGRAANVQFARIQPLPEKRDKGLELYPVLLQATTTYNDLGRLVAACESMPQLIRVERIGITAVTDGSVSVSILVTCFLHADGQP